MLESLFSVYKVVSLVFSILNKWVFFFDIDNLLVFRGIWWKYVSGNLFWVVNISF